LKLWNGDRISGVEDWLIHSKSMYVLISDQTGGILFANNYYSESFLDSKRANRKVTLAEQLHSSDLQGLEESMVHCLNNEFTKPIQIINRTRVFKTERYKSIKWEYSPLSPSEKGELYFIHVGHDLIAVENESQAHSHSNKTLNQLIDDIQIGVIIQDEHSKILLSNNKAEELLGVSKNELFERTVYDENWYIIKENGDPFPPDQLPAARVLNEKKEIRDVIIGVFNPDKERYFWFLADSNPDFNENGKVERVVTTFIDISERMEAEKALKAALLEKTTLLSEIHHRVKNNLAIVSGLLELQIMEVEDPIKIPLKRSINRIQSIAMVHELMYQTEQLSSVNLKNYLDKLIPGIQRTMESAKKIKINLDIQKCEVNINQAIPLGLLMNELLTNSYKYAFIETEIGEIDIAMEIKEDELYFSYKDSGPGFKHNNDFKDSSSLGLSLINAQLEQLHAGYKVNTKGCFELSFCFSISKRGPHSNIR
jgi:PAS domain S-box-containing protein